MPRRTDFLLDFAGPADGSLLRFACSRLHSPSGREIIRLHSGSIPVLSPDSPERYNAVIAHVLSTVALPRHRGSMTFTASAICVQLRHVTGQRWYCRNHEEIRMLLAATRPRATPQRIPWQCVCRYRNSVTAPCGSCGRPYRLESILPDAPDAPAPAPLRPRWTCWSQTCAATNLASRSTCHICGRSRIQPGADWDCTRCGVSNSATRLACHHCSSVRGPGPVQGPPAVPRPPSAREGYQHIRWQVATGETLTPAALAMGGLPFYGVELEIDDVRGNHCDQRAVTAMAHPLFYCKGDGSLTHGVEMVSHPGSEAWWREQTPLIRGLLSQLRQHQWQSHDAGTCGMHVHISRTAFHGSLHLYRFLSLVYRSPKLSLAISQRAPEKLAQWARLDTSARKHLKSKAGLGYQDPHRYEAVNMTHSTAEMRLFRGTLQPDRFYKNLEFCWAALRFTLETERIRSCDSKHFLAWLRPLAGEYPHLVQFLSETNIGKALGATNPQHMGDAPEVLPQLDAVPAPEPVAVHVPGAVVPVQAGTAPLPRTLPSLGWMHFVADVTAREIPPSASERA